MKGVDELAVQAALQPSLGVDAVYESGEAG